MAAIQKAMNDLAPAAHLCWAAAAVDDYRLAGDVKLLIEVDDAGKAAATIRVDTTRDTVLTGCLETIAEGYQWAPPMYGGATELPFAFSAPHGQNLIDRVLIPPVVSGARVLLDAKNSGNGAASLFELVVPPNSKPTASERTEAWIDLETLDALYLPPKAARAPAGGKRFVVVSVPGGTEDATRQSGILPAGPVQPNAPKAVPAPLAKAYVAERPKVGTVKIEIEAPSVSVSILETLPDAVVPEHVHDGSTEILYVLGGAGTMVVDGVTLPITPTSVVQIPAGVKHSFTASAATRAIQIYTPAGPEQKFKKK